jgi:hypothetical protein
MTDVRRQGPWADHKRLPRALFCEVRVMTLADQVAEIVNRIERIGARFLSLRSLRWTECADRSYCSRGRDREISAAEGPLPSLERGKVKSSRATRERKVWHRTGTKTQHLKAARRSSTDAALKRSAPQAQRSAADQADGLLTRLRERRRRKGCHTEHMVLNFSYGIPH